MRLRNWITLAPPFLKCVAKLPASHLWYLAKQCKNENPHYHNGRLYLNTFFPPYPSKAFDRFLDAVIHRRRIPYSAYFAVTDKCPFNCPHCSYGRHKKGSLDTVCALDVIKQIKSLGTVTIGFTGGEPLLRDDIVRLVASAGADTQTIIFTTGHRLNKKLAADLRHAGLGCIMIGIESDDPKEHDDARGVSGSFDEAIKAISMSLEAGLYTAISTVATQSKIAGGQIPRLAHLAEKYGVHELRILEPIPTGASYGRKDEILDPSQSKQLADFHAQWNRKNIGPAVSSFSYLESDEMFGCGAGFHHLFIDALANVCPCDLTPLAFGNLLEEPLEDIWRRMGQVFDLPRCRCLMKDICTRTPALGSTGELPLTVQQSLALCSPAAGQRSLPKIYRNLFRHRKPVSPPLNQP